MRQTQQFHEGNRPRRGVIRALALAALLSGAALGLHPPASAGAYDDPVEGLRRALKVDPSFSRDTSVAQRKFRAENLEKQIARLTSPGDLVRALLLQEWRDLDIKKGVEEISVDGDVRNKLAARLEDEFRKALRSDNGRAWAAANMIGKTAVEARKNSGNLDLQGSGRPGPGLLVREHLKKLAPDLAKLTDQESPQTTRPPEVRAAAAIALGQVEGGEDRKEEKSTIETVIVPALERMLDRDTPPCRRAAAEALANLMRILAQPERKNEQLLRGEQLRKEVVRTGSSVVRAAGRHLHDSDPGVDRPCAEAMLLTAAALANEVSNVPTREVEGFPPAGREPSDKEKDDMRRYAEEVRKERMGLMPLMKALGESVPTLVKAAQDPSRGDDIRIAVFNALEQMGYARERLQQRRDSVPPAYLEGADGAKGAGAGPAKQVAPVGLVERQPGAKKTDEDPLLEGLRTAIHLLRAGLEADVPVRLAALDAVEMLGPQAEEAVPALNRNLTHASPFVRRASARVLGKIGPVKESDPVPRLAWLLEFDPDFDVRVTAATALDRYGPAAIAAAPAAANVVASPRNDAEIRMVAARSLGNMGASAAKVGVPALAAALSDPDVRVRREAVQTLYHFRQHAAGAREQLRQAVGDSDPEVSRIASEALLQITP